MCKCIVTVWSRKAKSGFEAIAPGQGSQKRSFPNRADNIACGYKCVFHRPGHGRRMHALLLEQRQWRSHSIDFESGFRKQLGVAEIILCVNDVNEPRDIIVWTHPTTALTATRPALIHTSPYQSSSLIMRAQIREPGRVRLLRKGRCSPPTQSAQSRRIPAH